MLNMPRRPSKTAPVRAREIPEDTRSRILDAAERLFAERGIDAVSVRAVLKEAGVNGALANYHFGSRVGLIEELLKTRVTSRDEELIRAIDDVDARGREATLEDVLRAYFAPSARVATENPTLGKLFAQLQFSANPEIRELGREALRPVLSRFGAALAKRVPSGIAPGQQLLRLYMVLAAPFYFGAQWGVVMRSARKRLDPGAMPDAEMLTEELVAFCAAGLRASGSNEKAGLK